ncbi:hypothetical protein H310_13259 [Aphanomyces invadans]|uniref:Protein cereblon n=1 Tax=Aphanomyces invadans TaxID=157072 RepID=A0A024TEB6_9STRA|nr:hypothetical protein H310_13259 [Aphanomyces invadans]ETV92359.1 hypothetical protein H310_13259 [Aphanomyces invadans]|eukprot:XP_008878910.1 hypothetical protein H310_13259 [Aphanomyces invadans]
MSVLYEEDDAMDMVWSAESSQDGSPSDGDDLVSDEGDAENIDPFIVDHSYLGEDLSVAAPSSSAHFTPGSIVVMPLVWLPDTVIFPGETLPLRMLATSTLQLMTTRLRNGQDTFALTNANMPRHVGTVIQIERMYEYGVHHLSIVGRGRQRFELEDRVSVHHTRGQYMEGVSAHVRILPDYHAIPCPLPLTARRCHSSLKRRRPALVAYWGPHQYMQFDGPALVLQAKSILLQSVEFHAFMASSTSTASSAATAAMSAPSDPTRFSYWLAAHLNLGLPARQRLLATSSVIARLRSLIAWLHQQSAVIQCAGCATTLASTRSIFLKHDPDHGGPVTTFANPNGDIHQILTMLSVDRSMFRTYGHPTLTDTWFPGYTWQCISCRHCSNFLGWRYVSTVDQVHPHVFFGLLRNAIS